MIKLLEAGVYKLFETNNNENILWLDDNKKAYLWKNAKSTGDLQYTKFNEKDICCLLSFGNYRLYDVNKESELTCCLHISLHLGNSKWQGYLLPKNLPTSKKKTKPIKKTAELITKSGKKVRFIV